MAVGLLLDFHAFTATTSVSCVTFILARFFLVCFQPSPGFSTMPSQHHFANDSLSISSLNTSHCFIMKPNITCHKWGECRQECQPLPPLPSLVSRKDINRNQNYKIKTLYYNMNKLFLASTFPPRQLLQVDTVLCSLQAQTKHAATGQIGSSFGSMRAAFGPSYQRRMLVSQMGQCMWFKWIYFWLSKMHSWKHDHVLLGCPRKGNQVAPFW